jgi:hypothetical protein
MQEIRRVDRYIKRGVVEGTLRTLHPVNDAFAFFFGEALFSYRYSRIGCELFEIHLVRY